MIVGRVDDSNMDDPSSLSNNLFADLVYYLEVGEFGLGWLLDILFVNCTSDMTIVFFYSVFQTSAGFSYVRKGCIFLVGPFVDCFVLLVMGLYL